MRSKKISHKILTLLIFFIALNGCGFKPLSMKNINNISLVKLDTTGNNVINFKISNNLKQSLGFKKSNPTKIAVAINSKKEKTIKEKNTKNEITKYNLTIITEIKVNVLEDNTSFSFVLKKLNEYKVDDQYSITFQNEKKATDEILNLLSKEIVKNILLKMQ
jgi:hypothetical protein|tara:strand:+ start:230 stop:715 length:486 start_codon:yes stop_codon:yes gene_type:complete